MAANPQDISTAAGWYVDHSSFLRGRAAKSVGQDADDLYQDLFVKILEGGNLHEIEDPERYLTRTQSNEFVRHWRKPVRAELPVEDVFVESEADVEIGAALEMAEGGELLRRCLPMLKGRQREVVKLKLLDKSRDEIAEILELSPHAVTQLMNRAHRKLERKLLQEGYVRSLLPWPAVGWLRDKVRQWGDLLGQQPRIVEALAISAILVVVSVTPEGPAISTPSTSRSTSITTAPVQSDPGLEVTNDSAGRSQVDSMDSRSDSKLSGGRTTTIDIRHGDTSAWLEESDEERSEPTLEKQVQELIQDPRRALPTCPESAPCP